jgi:hypothetical protein
VSSGNPLPTFRDKISVPSSRDLDFLTLEDGTDRFFRNDYHSTLRKIPEERKSQDWKHFPRN